MHYKLLPANVIVITIDRFHGYFISWCPCICQRLIIINGMVMTLIGSVTGPSTFKISFAYHMAGVSRNPILINVQTCFI